VTRTLKRSRRSFDCWNVGNEKSVRVEKNRRFKSPGESASVRYHLHGFEGPSLSRVEALLGLESERAEPG
jgi:hypothetical protein